MNLFNIARVNLPRNTYQVRQERIKREGSPYYSWTPAALASGASIAIYVPTAFPDSRKYEPLDWIEVVNNEASNDLTLTINNDTALIVPASSIRAIANLALWHIKLTNDGGATTTLNKIRVTLQRQPLTIDKWARRQA